MKDKITHHPKREESIDYLVRSIGLAMRAIAEKKLSVFNITNAQGRVLGAIYYHGKYGMEVSRKDLQETMQISGPSITSLLNGLEKKGLIIRTPDRDDNRLIDLKVTREGEKIVLDMMGLFEELKELAVKGLSADEKTTLIKLLQRVEKNVRE